MYTYTSSSEEWLAFLKCWEKKTVNKLSKQEELYTEYEKRASVASTSVSELEISSLKVYIA